MALKFDQNIIDALLHVEAPAKLNLRLRVLGRRSDGYHLLDMINVTTRLCDHLTVVLKRESGVSLSLEGSSDELSRALPDTQERNLAYRAAATFIDAFEIKLGVAIRLKKQIPVGAGLGGGSSDAGAVLRLLMRHFHPLDNKRESYHQRVLHIAEQIGSDVPYFLVGGLCRVRGIGEEVDYLGGETLDGVPCMIYSPSISLLTADIFRQFAEEERENSHQNEKFMHNAAIESLRTSPATFLWNDLEQTVCAASKEVDSALQFFRSLPGIAASITGSGSSIVILDNLLKRFDKSVVAKVHKYAHQRGATLFASELIGRSFEPYTSSRRVIERTGTSM